MLYKGNRNTSGDGSAIFTAGAAQYAILRGYVFLQITETGPVSVILKFIKNASSVQIHSTIKLVSDGDGVVLELPVVASVAGAALHINLDAAKSVNYTIDVDVVELL